jgi:AcrR family transcriptional regulator
VKTHQTTTRTTGGGRPRSPRRAAHWDAQRRALIAAAQRAIRKKGPAVSMDDIAAEAHVAKPILYRHFGDRAGLARALGESVLLLGSDDKARMLDRMSAFYPTVDNAEDFRRVFQGFLGQFSAFVEMDTDVYRFLQTEQALQRMMQGSDGRRLRNPVAESLARSLSSILQQRGLDPRPAELWANVLVALATGGIDWWADQKPFHRHELERYVLDLAWHGVSGLLGHSPPRAAPSKPAAGARASARKRKRHPR